MKILSDVDRDQAQSLGERILKAFEIGRTLAHARAQSRAQELRAAVLRLAAQDKAMGRRGRGRAARIARRLQGLVSTRHTARILKKFRHPD